MATALTGKKGTIQLSKEMVQDLLEASTRVIEIAETLEVQLDKKTMRRLRRGGVGPQERQVLFRPQ